MASREEDELSEEQHMAQFDPDPGVDKEGFYPGEREYNAQHRKEVTERDAKEAKDYKDAEEALLAEVSADLKDHRPNKGSGSAQVRRHR